MSEVKKVSTPLTDEVIKGLKAGDMVALSGVIYTARDKAHKIMTDLLKEGKELPADFKGQIIYYAGPTPEKPGQPIGSIGPTTSSRMDAFAPMMMDVAGLKGMLGKGPRDKGVVDAMLRNTCVYMVAIGGTGAAISKCVKSAQTIAYPELQSEAVRRLEVEDLPCIVAIDCEGGNLFEQGIAQYRQE